MKISIITINFNDRKGLCNTIESVLSQSYCNIEYIVIDGGSTDGSAELIKNKQERIAFWISEPDTGIYNAMNKGIAHATGDYCLFLNSGDCLHSNDTITEFVSKLNGEDMIMGKIQCVPSGKIAYEDVSYPYTMMDFFEGCPVPHPACLIRRNLFDEQLYDEKLKIVSDWKFFMSMIIFKNHSYNIVDVVVTDFLEQGVSSNRELCEKERHSTLKEILPKAIYADYESFATGCSRRIEYYDTFFRDLKKYNKRLARLIYKLAFHVVSFLSKSKISLRFVQDYKNHAFDDTREVD